MKCAWCEKKRGRDQPAPVLDQQLCAYCEAVALLQVVWMELAQEECYEEDGEWYNYRVPVLPPSAWGEQEYPACLVFIKEYLKARGLIDHAGRIQEEQDRLPQYGDDGMGG